VGKSEGHCQGISGKKVPPRKNVHKRAVGKLGKHLNPEEGTCGEGYIKDLFLLGLFHHPETWEKKKVFDGSKPASLFSKKGAPQKNTKTKKGPQKEKHKRRKKGSIGKEKSGHDRVLRPLQQSKALVQIDKVTNAGEKTHRGGSGPQAGGGVWGGMKIQVIRQWPRNLNKRRGGESGRGLCKTPMRTKRKFEREKRVRQIA